MTIATPGRVSLMSDRIRATETDGPSGQCGQQVYQFGTDPGGNLRVRRSDDRLELGQADQVTDGDDGQGAGQRRQPGIGPGWLGR